MFKGFDVEYPVYTVVCPQTGFEYDVRSLTVSEVSKLKTSLTTPAAAPKIINQMLWKSLVRKPEFIKNYNDFKRYTTLRDREALMFGLYVNTFGSEREFELSCIACDNKQSVKIDLNKMFQINAYPASKAMKQSYKVAKAADDEVYDPEIEKAIQNEVAHNTPDVNMPPPGMPEELARMEFGDQAVEQMKQQQQNGIQYADDPQPQQQNNQQQQSIDNLLDDDSILKKRIEVELPVTRAIAVIRQPTIQDEEEVLGELAFAQKKHADLVTEVLIIDHFIQLHKDGRRTIINNREDIFWGYQSLTPKDKLKIFDEFQNNFGQYGIELKSTYDCTSCGEENEVNLDIFIQFFRMVRLT